jgi:Rrf2 family transcriptional regulator, iron-sulfur cluster assembly transcription factor
MRLSTRGRFAITAMIDLALRESGQPAPLQDIALRHRISLSYLEQVFAKLRQHGLVESTRGPGGGYALGFRGDSITVADIISAIEDKQESCRETSQSAQDMTRDLWAALQSTVVAHMRTITLRSLADEQRAKGFAVKERKLSKKGVLQKIKPLAPVRTNAPNSVFALGQGFSFNAGR